MSDPTQELQVRAMAALRRRGEDTLDTLGTVVGIQAVVGGVTISTSLEHRLMVLVAPRGKPRTALFIQTSGKVSFFPEARNRALDILRREQVLDDLADV